LSEPTIRTIDIGTKKKNFQEFLMEQDLLNKTIELRMNSFKNRDLKGPELKVNKTEHSKYNLENFDYVKELVEKHKEKTRKYSVITQNPVIFEEYKDFTILYRRQDNMVQKQKQEKTDEILSKIN
jgi:hypothetical protein